jgi:hypothetical protein
MRLEASPRTRQKGNIEGKKGFKTEDLMICSDMA